MTNANTSSELFTTADVITALGGPTEVAKVLAFDDPARVSNWKRGGKFPANTYKALRRLLALRQLSAPDDLWAMLDLPRDIEISRAERVPRGR